MTELKKFVVYKMSIANMVYIGSTCDLRKRIIWHKSDCYNQNKCHYNKLLYKYIRDNHIDFIDIEVEVLEEVENLFLSNRENEINARKREQYYINNQNEITGGNLLNDIRAYISEEEYKEYMTEKQAEWYQNNKERIAERGAQYYQQNKQKIKEIQSQKIDCPCGSIYTRSNKARHFKSKKHVDYLSKIKK
jgi:hypothetical protein